MWPWVPSFVLVVTCASGVSIALALSLLLPGRSRRDDPEGWRGVPARWLASTSRDVGLAVACPALAEAIASRIPLATTRHAVVKENDLWGLAPVALAVVVFASPLVWWLTHPSMRVVNTSYEPLVVYVDGRSFGLVPAVAGEAPNAAIRLRVPRGWRRLKAVSLDGTIMDEVDADVGAGDEQLYAPASKGLCFWVEQRAYGRAYQPKPAHLALSNRVTFHSFPGPIDAWFQPNPETAGPDHWFSGGIRRAVRHGPCPGPGRSGAVESKPAR
jgi:hypothetical protein